MIELHTYEVPVDLTVDREVPPPDRLLHDAMRNIVSFEITAPTQEIAEAYAHELVEAIIYVANRPPLSKKLARAALRFDSKRDA